MIDQYKVIDCDRDILEPDDIWDKYLDSPFRHYDLQSRRATLAGVRLGVVDQDNNKPPRGKKSYPSWMGFSHYPGWRMKFKNAIWRHFDNVSYIDDMNAEGVDIAFVFPTGGLYFLWDDALDPELAAAMCRAYNNWLYDYTALNPDRMKGVCLIPLHDPKLAVQELRRAGTELGFRSIFTRPNPLRGRSLTDPAYYEVYAAASELDMALCIHEGAETSLPQFGRGRTDTMFARHILSHPAEQMSAMVSMIAEGIFDRFPDFHVAYLESGCGWLPFWLDRLEALSCNPLLRDGYTANLKPGDYFKRGQLYISCEAGEEAVPWVGRTIGEDNLMWASDYPHPEVIFTFPDTLRPFVDDEALSSEFKRKILWDNPVRFYSLKV